MSTILNPSQLIQHRVEKLRIVKESAQGTKKGLFSGLPDPTGLTKQVDGFISGLKDDVFEVQINPEKYERTVKINYRAPQAQGEPAPTQQFNRVEGETLSISFILDGTGVVPPSTTNPNELLESAVAEIADFAKRSAGLGGYTDTGYVTRRIIQLKKIAVDYVDETHEPPIVIIIWGDAPPFRGRLVDLKVTYTLFNPDGTPLRAEIQVQFKEHQERSQLATAGLSGGEGLAAMAVSKVGGLFRSSPDLSHTRLVSQADTLPLMTENIYKDASYYWQVARANGLTHFRALEIGTELLFPPIER
jgi:Contractile injection system tube protein